MIDSDIYDYLLQMGVMRPEQEVLMRKQAIVDELRQRGMTPGQGQMVSGHYVPSGLAGLAGQLGQAYFAKQGQGAVDQRMGAMNQRQRQMLEEIRKRKMMQNAGTGSDFMTDYNFQIEP